MQKDLDGVIAEAKTLGASYVIVAWIPHTTAFTSTGAGRHRQLQRLGRQAEGRGPRLRLPHARL
jgi:hypothetical protein